MVMAHKFANQFEKVSCAKLFHNIRTMKLHGTRAYAEPPSAFLAGGSPNDVSQNSALARCQHVTARSFLGV